MCLALLSSHWSASKHSNCKTSCQYAVTHMESFAEREQLKVSLKDLRALHVQQQTTQIFFIAHQNLSHTVIEEGFVENLN